MSLNRQAVFETVATHLLYQANPSRDGIGGSCMYRGKDARKCAIGCLIPDDEYALGIEGMSADTTVTDSTRLPNGIVRSAAVRLADILAKTIGADGFGDLAFLRALQIVHDNGSSVGDFMPRLVDFGKSYRLDISFLYGACNVD